MRTRDGGTWGACTVRSSRDGGGLTAPCGGGSARKRPGDRGETVPERGLRRRRSWPGPGRRAALRTPARSETRCAVLSLRLPVPSAPCCAAEHLSSPLSLSLSPSPVLLLDI